MRALIKAAEQWREATAHEPPAHRNLRAALNRVVRARNVERALGIIEEDEYEEMTDEERARFAKAPLPPLRPRRSER